MLNLLVSLLVIVPFVAAVIALYRALIRRVASGKVRVLGALLFYWLAVAVLPWLITWVLVPVLNSIFVSYPALQESAWDVGLALTLYLGMCVSYILGVIAGGLTTWRFISRSNEKYGESAT